MIAALANTEFLPTNTSPMDSPFMIAGFVVSGLIMAAIIVYFFLMRKDFVSYMLSGGLMGLVVAFAVPLATWMSLAVPIAEANRDNLTENIQTVYDIDSVMFEDEAQDAKIAKPSPLTITVTKDGKAYKVILNQDKETFEPNLSSFETDSIDIETLKRDKY